MGRASTRAVWAVMGLAGCHRVPVTPWPEADSLDGAASAVLYELSSDGSVAGAVAIDLESRTAGAHVSVEDEGSLVLALYGCPLTRLSLDEGALVGLTGAGPLPGKALASDGRGGPWSTLDSPPTLPWPKAVALPSPCWQFQSELVVAVGEPGLQPIHAVPLGGSRLLVAITSRLDHALVTFDGFDRPDQVRSTTVAMGFESIAGYGEAEEGQAWVLGQEGQMAKIEWVGDRAQKSDLDPWPGYIPCDQDRQTGQRWFTGTAVAAGGRRADGTLEILFFNNCGGLALFEDPPNRLTVIHDPVATVDPPEPLAALRLGDDEWLIGDLAAPRVLRYEGLGRGSKTPADAAPTALGLPPRVLIGNPRGEVFLGTGFGTLQRREPGGFATVATFGTEAVHGMTALGDGVLASAGDDGVYQYQPDHPLCDGDEDRPRLRGSDRLHQFFHRGEHLLAVEHHHIQSDPEVRPRLFVYRPMPPALEECQQLRRP